MVVMDPVLFELSDKGIIAHRAAVSPIVTRSVALLREKSTWNDAQILTFLSMLADLANQAGEEGVRDSLFIMATATLFSTFWPRPPSERPPPDVPPSPDADHAV